ncbi:hypothetical protein [Chryseobacterium sp. YIM B08800]|uniref:hypothetical protein n=1 Tax=Chryseobacterium sp. YIM B08800 TaxID=2984136 RepID=UPI00223FCA17|nr:hypothetical protein [Chryseobacterium sp. YIM B08800]
MKKIFKILLLLLTFLCYGQKNYFVITIDKIDKNYPNEHPLYFWIIDLSEKDSKPAPLYFWDINKENVDDCSKYNGISVFNEDQSISSLDNLLEKIYKNRKQVLNLEKQWIIGRNKKPIKFKVFITPISADLFSCNISQREGEKINYQGKVYFLNEKFIISEKLLETNTNGLESLKWINFSFVKTYPYSQ